MSNTQEAIQNYREAAQTLLLRAEMLEEATPSVDAATGRQHLEDASTFALLTEQWDAEQFVSAGAGVRGTIQDLAAIFAERVA